MKKIFLENKWVTPVFIMASFLLSSCLKDNDYEDGQYQLATGPGTEGSEYVSIPLANKRPNPMGLEQKPGFQTVELFKVSYDYKNPAGEDIIVTIERNDAVVKPVDSTAVLIPAGNVTLPATDIVIPKGKRASDELFKISINTGDLDPLKLYGIGFTIKSVSKAGVAIPDNNKNVVFTFPIKNKYDGHYSFKGYVTRIVGGVLDPLSGNFNDPAGMDLITTGPNKVEFGSVILWSNLSAVGGVGLQTLTINPDGSVITSDSVNPTFMNNTAAGYNTRYDEATRTFFLSSTWSTPGTRELIDTLTYIGPR